jgi:hypothetical protein
METLFCWVVQIALVWSRAAGGFGFEALALETDDPADVSGVWPTHGAVQ